jgi:hypothetical protein
VLESLVWYKGLGLSLKSPMLGIIKLGSINMLYVSTKPVVLVNAKEARYIGMICIVECHVCLIPFEHVQKQ